MYTILSIQKNLNIKITVPQHTFFNCLSINMSYKFHKQVSPLITYVTHKKNITNS